MKRISLLFIGLSVFIFGARGQWALTGNSITSGNFLGTTNAQPLVFKVNNISAGRIEVSSGNSFYGYQSGLSNTANYNTGIGYLSLYSNTTGLSNVGVGYQSLYRNTTGNWNVGLGSQAVMSNTTGHDNIGVGAGSLYYSTTGSMNVCVGTNTAFNNSTGTSIMAMGMGAAFSNTTGSRKVAIGTAALYSDTASFDILAIGDSALYTFNSGSTYSRNMAIGNSALFATTTGSLNTGVGSGALITNSSGWANTGIGYSILSSNTTGSYNTAMGSQAMITNQTGNNNSAFGCFADVSSNNLSNATAIGAGAIVNASNKIRLGNSSVTVIEGNAAYTVSDKRFKKNITDSVLGLTFIRKLHPVVYNLEARKFDEFTMQKLPSDKREKVLQQSDYTEAEKIRRSGFLAQEVEEAARAVHYNFDGVHAPKNDNDNYSLSYSAFVVPLVKSVQELSNANDSLKAVIDSLKDAQKNMQAQISAILNELNGLKTGKLLSGDLPVLQQNAPNPFNGSTVINYYLPSSVSNAQLVITDGAGHVLKDVELGSRGQGQAVINAGELASGTYFYSLVVNNKRVATRTMVLTR